jgi:hypothetical protein
MSLLGDFGGLLDIAILVLFILQTALLSNHLKLTVVRKMFARIEKT